MQLCLSSCGLTSGIKVVFFHVKLESNYLCVPTFGTFQFYHKSTVCGTP
jgi:hypothetical protein